MLILTMCSIRSKPFKIQIHRYKLSKIQTVKAATYWKRMYLLDLAFVVGVQPNIDGGLQLRVHQKKIHNVVLSTI